MLIHVRGESINLLDKIHLSMIMNALYHIYKCQPIITLDIIINPTLPTFFTNFTPTPHAAVPPPSPC